jgi:hypothetical protein
MVNSMDTHSTSRLGEYGVPQSTHRTVSDTFVVRQIGFDDRENIDRYVEMARQRIYYRGLYDPRNDIENSIAVFGACDQGGRSIAFAHVCRQLPNAVRTTYIEQYAVHAEDFVTEAPYEGLGACTLLEDAGLRFACTVPLCRVVYTTSSHAGRCAHLSRRGWIGLGWLPDPTTGLSTQTFMRIASLPLPQ